MSWRVLEDIGGCVDPGVRHKVLAFHTQANWTLATPDGFPRPSQVAISNAPSDVIEGSAHHDHSLSHINPAGIALLPTSVAGPLRRPSAREFCPGYRMSRQELSDLLALSFAVQPDGRRTYPSAGALYPVGVAVLGLAGRMADESLSGAFHYRPSRHSLESLREIEDDALNQALFGTYSGHFRNAACALVYFFNVNVAVFKYRYRGYRNTLYEIGAMGQQVDLVAAHIDLATRLWSGFSDTELARVIGLNPSVAPISIVQLIGRDRSGV